MKFISLKVKIVGVLQQHATRRRSVSTPGFTCGGEEYDSDQDWTRFHHTSSECLSGSDEFNTEVPAADEETRNSSSSSSSSSQDPSEHSAEV